MLPPVALVQDSRIYGVFIMTPIGWSLALIVWGYELVWFVINDQAKVAVQEDPSLFMIFFWRGLYPATVSLGYACRKNSLIRNKNAEIGEEENKKTVSSWHFRSLQVLRRQNGPSLSP